MFIKESKRDDNMAKKDKSEKKVVNKQPNSKIRLYSLEELADLFGVTVLQMKSMYAIRGIDKNDNLGYDEAYEKFNNII